MQEFRDLLVAEVNRRLFEESVPRLKKCLVELEEKEIWYRPNENSNSVGNLVLHLCGNVRQWVLTGLAGQPDVRQRQTEFDERGPLPTADLIAKVDKLEEDVRAYLEVISPEKILEPCTVQGFKENGLSVLVHVVEHFSYHVGQMTYFVKWRKDMDMDYYGAMDLDVTGK